MLWGLHSNLCSWEQFHHSHTYCSTLFKNSTHAGNLLSLELKVQECKQESQIQFTTVESLKFTKNRIFSYSCPQQNINKGLLMGLYHIFYR